MHWQPVKRTLRVFFSNLSSNQFALEGDEASNMVLDNTDLSSSSLDLLKENIPSWTLKIQARLLDVCNPWAEE